MISSKRIIKLLCNKGRQAVAPSDRLFSSVGDHGAVKVKPTRVVKILVDTRLYDQDPRIRPGSQGQGSDKR